MSRVPRLLPLLAIAVGGVLAVKVVASIDGAPDFLKQATAWAEDAAPGDKKAAKPAKKGDKPPAVDAKKSDAPAPDPLGGPAPLADAAADAATPAAGVVPLAPVCAPTAAELAKEAGLSPAELRVLQSLQSRRGALDARSQAMDTQMALLTAAELKVDGKIKSLNGLKDELQAMIGQADAKQDAEVARLVTVYSKMKPDQAAAVMSQLDDRVSVPVAGKMKEAILAAILNKMPAAEAKKLTEKLAARYSTTGIQNKIAQAETQPAAAAAAAPAAPKAVAPARKRAAKPRPNAAPKAAAAAAPAAAAPKPTPAKAPPQPLAPGKVN